jgi:hypothetical protein
MKCNRCYNGFNTYVKEFLKDGNVITAEAECKKCHGTGHYVDNKFIDLNWDGWCTNCGWPVIHVAVNDEFKNFKDAGKWDWWSYCSNKGCKNHDGEGVFQDSPSWTSRS